MGFYWNLRGTREAPACINTAATVGKYGFYWNVCGTREAPPLKTRCRRAHDDGIGARPPRWGWIICVACLSLFVASLLVSSLRAFAQAPAPPTATVPGRMSSEERAMVIVRARELEMTRLVALYANRLEEALDEIQQLKTRLAAQLPCPGEPGATPSIGESPKP